MSLSELLDGYFASLNSEDWDRLASLFHPEAELWAVGTRTRRGPEQVQGYFRDALSPYPEHLDSPTRTILAGSTATVEIRFEGRLANGNPLSFDAVDVFDELDGRIRRLTSWYDSARVRRDLLDASLVDGPPSEITPARLRAGLAEVRGLGVHLLRGSWAGPPLAGRAVILSGHAGEGIAEVAAREGVAVRGGDVLILDGLAADGSLPEAAAVLSSEWSGVSELSAACRDDRRFEGFVTLSPEAAVVLR